VTAPGGSAAPTRSLTRAVATAAVLVAAVVAALFAGESALFVLICVAVLVALFELLSAVRAGGGRPSVGLALASTLGLLVAARAERPLWFAVSLGATVVGSLVLALRPRRGESPIGDSAWMVLAVVWIGGGGAAAVGILGSGDNGRWLLGSYLVVVAATDIGAYFAGTLLGRHKLAPSVSPAKTWEGVVAGAVSALGAGVATGSLAAGLAPLEGLGLGIVCGLGAPVGDLVESLAKRELAIKDSGRLLPGHGGVLDRLDAMIFCAPAVLAYLHVVVR
jgi:phosphatidate cytidylyltransferase